ncbi:hypothetical protein LTR37_011407 [Vermiconidia calcicola]|uniref:Uncharacterized protein n=1 Tax=Vermiconidia calcicola TaxID=1690605 RepID=A0ACC3N426_9PEZI|nr:hypothetical protein LTR37_011407 [Vermiconidia calcicola]
MSLSISVRKYIRWLPEPASEPTTTIVLTSPERRFVDIRILKSTDADPADERAQPVLHASRIDWAFAGFSSSELQTGADGSQFVHSTWKHWVSSRVADADGVVDEGDMFPQADGTTLEKGKMVNPATGRETEYEEVWEDPKPTTTTEGDGEKVMCAVLQLHDDAHQARGMVVRVGQFCQGVLRIGESMSLERWQWKSHGGWKRQVRIGDQWLPCGVLLDGQRVRMGGEVKHGEFSWRVVELSES